MSRIRTLIYCRKRMRQAGHEQQVRSTIEDTGESAGKQKNSSCGLGGFGFRDLCSGRCAAGTEFGSADGG